MTLVPAGDEGWTQYVRFFSRYIATVALVVIGGLFIWLLIARILRGG